MFAVLTWPSPFKSPFSQATLTLAVLLTALLVTRTVSVPMADEEAVYKPVESTLPVGVLSSVHVNVG